MACFTEIRQSMYLKGFNTDIEPLEISECIGFGTLRLLIFDKATTNCFKRVTAVLAANYLRTFPKT